MTSRTRSSVRVDRPLSDGRPVGDDGALSRVRLALMLGISPVAAVAILLVLPSAVAADNCSTRLDCWATAAGAASAAFGAGVVGVGALYFGGFFADPGRPPPEGFDPGALTGGGAAGGAGGGAGGASTSGEDAGTTGGANVPRSDRDHVRQRIEEMVAHRRHRADNPTLGDRLETELWNTDRWLDDLADDANNYIGDVLLGPDRGGPREGEPPKGGRGITRG